MSALDLIGAVGAASLRNRLDATVGEEDAGVARFMLDQLTGPQVAAICQAVLEAPGMGERVAIRLPRALVAGFGLPEEVLTDDETVAHRHSVCDRPALLLANTADNQGASLRQVTRFGVKQLTEDPGLWVRAAAHGLGLSEEDQEVWKTALSGLFAAKDWTLPQVAGYVDLTQRRIREESRPLADALGWALPALELPRDSGYFLAIRPREFYQPARWRRLYEQAVAQRRPLLSKQTSSRQLIEPDELERWFKNVRDQIPEAAHPAIRDFIAAPPAWTDASAALADWEWEQDNILQLFTGLREKKTSLPSETLHFFDFTLPDALSEEDSDYLHALEGRKSLKDARDEDVEFYERHREELAGDRTLRAKWDRFIYGKPIETTDFLGGLLSAIERLYEQADSFEGPKSLTIRTHRRSKSDWLALNADVVTCFALRYRGLPELTAPYVTWETYELFRYEDLLHEAATHKKYKRTTSTARIATQIKFDIELQLGSGSAARYPAVQLVWQGTPDALGTELPRDLDRLIQRPFVRNGVTRQAVNRKGHLQSVSLGDASSLEAAFQRDAGSLVPKYDAAEDIDVPLRAALDAARDDGRLGPEAHAEIGAAWSTFADAYSEALQAWRTQGIAEPALLRQADAYANLLEVLDRRARGDVVRQELVEPVLSLGCIRIDGGAPAAIVAPWHPLRIAAIVVKARSVAGLLNRILAADEVDFGDPRLFFTDLRTELAHPYYPEVTVGYLGSEPVLLAASDTLNDYTLMERPVQSGDDDTNEDPTDAATRIRSLVARYLELQPHEHANLSLALYNCDSAGLPLATVGALSSYQNGEEIHCDIVLRHRDEAKLSRLYTEMLESVESDPDSVVASETSRNFLSKLRVGIMLDGATPADATGGRSLDMAFLQDVVSRRAREAWIAQPPPQDVPDLLEHVPPRWSYKRSGVDEELKSTAYLACPRQPRVGWAYLDAVAAVVTRSPHSVPGHRLPARQVSFQDHSIRTLLEEVHGLAEWVVNYDDLLDRRQLLAQGIHVIRYQRQRSHGRNVVVSSTSELRVLHVLVKRRLEELNLGLPEERIRALARRLIEEASSVSGDIVLRAARRGTFAGELLGVVLSKALVVEELGADAPIAWFFLDDYASWLGQREEGIADLLALSPQRVGDEIVLRAVVTEAKYVSGATVAEERRTSRRQVHDTVRRIDEALFGNPGRLDRDLWLSRLSDLLLDGIGMVRDAQAFDSLRDHLPRGTVRIDLRGYSHVFVSGPADGGPAGDQEEIPGVRSGFQEVFSRDQVRALLRALEAGAPLGPIRAESGNDRPWLAPHFELPAPRVIWVERDAAPLSATPVEVQLTPDGGARLRHPPTLSAQSPVPEGEEQPLAQSPAEERESSPPVVPAPRMTGFQQLLDNGGSVVGPSGTGEEWLQETTARLRSALLSYQLQAKVLGTRLTPNAALIRLMGSDRLTVDDIERRQSSLLTTHALRVISVSARPGEIVVALERPEREIVPLWEVWRRRAVNRTDGGLNLSFVLGVRELDGELLYLNLGGPFGGLQQHEPHTLVAGATGSGKSVLLQNLLLDIAATNPSRLARIHLIDPKMGVDYAAIERLPHVQGGIVTTQEEALRVLESLVKEMDRRYEVFREAGVRDLAAYNRRAGVEQQLPALWLVHDEFAEWMLTEDYKDAVASHVQRLGVKARAAGIYLIFAAQRPDVNVMPMQLRDNLGNRLVLRVASVGTSEIALGAKGAERLLGKGHLVARLAGEPDLIYAQVPFLSDDDMLEAADAIARDNTEHG